jgi:hypothetical protein
MGKPMNFYCDDELMQELEAEAKALTLVLKPEPPFTPQQMLRMAWSLRPPSLRLAKAKRGASKR